MAKILTVATEVQKAVFEKVLMTEIASGFWKNARPADHADNWKGVQVVVSEQGEGLGVTGFEMPRNYNFVNPQFFSKAENALMESAKTVDADVTVKKLKKQLISLNQILGARLKEVGGPVAKLARGRKTPSATEKSEPTKNATTVRKAMATFVDAEPAEV